MTGKKILVFEEFCHRMEEMSVFVHNVFMLKTWQHCVIGLSRLPRGDKRKRRPGLKSAFLSLSLYLPPLASLLFLSFTQAWDDDDNNNNSSSPPPLWFPCVAVDPRSLLTSSQPLFYFLLVERIYKYILSCAILSFCCCCHYYYYTSSCLIFPRSRKV